jgi:hypothetical protein
LTCVHGLFLLTHLSQKQIESVKIAGNKYVPVDFKEIFYKVILLLLADWRNDIAAPYKGILSLYHQSCGVENQFISNYRK